MDIELLGAHNCESQDTRLPSLLIDGCMALDAGGLTSGLSFSAQQKLKAILLTHQHFDHLRDVMTIGMNFFLAGKTIDIYSILPAYDALATHLLGSKIYPNFLERPPGNPTLKFMLMEPLQTAQIEGYHVLPVPVSHSVSAVGYQITSHDGKMVFYTGDTGPGLADCWRGIFPQVLIIEVTASDRFSDFGREAGHLTPSLLKGELVIFREHKGYLPEVIAIHMSPGLEEEIRAELAEVSRDLNSPITPGYEGMKIHL